MFKVPGVAHAVVATLWLVACQKAPPQQTQAAAVVPMAAPVPQPAASVVPTVRLATASYALFEGTEVIMCIDATGPADKIAAIKPDGFVVLKQTCDSLGRTELTSCTNPNYVSKYYTVKRSDKYMADCVKGAGQWSTNKSTEAQLARAEQDLQAVKKAAGIHD